MGLLEEAVAELHRVLGVFACIGIFLPWIVLCLPTTLYEILVGYLFGVWQGALINAAGKLIGSNAAFFLGRYCFKQRVERLALRRAEPPQRAGPPEPALVRGPGDRAGAVGRGRRLAGARAEPLRAGLRLPPPRGGRRRRSVGGRRRGARARSSEAVPARSAGIVWRRRGSVRSTGGCLGGRSLFARHRWG